MRIRHYALFNNGLRNLDWDRLRDEETEFSYYVPFTREEYLARVEQVPQSSVGHSIAAFIRQHSIHTALSVGIGIGALEYGLRDVVDRLIVTDVTDSIDRIQSFEVFDVALRFDILRDPLPDTDIELAILPRVDTEFTDSQFREIYAKLHESSIRYVCLVPVGLLNVRMILAECRTWLRSAVGQRRPVFSGFYRSARGLERTWRAHYRVLVAEPAAPVFFLEAK